MLIWDKYYLDKNEKHFHPHLCVIHSFRLSLECFDADRRSLEGKKLNENSHRSPSFYTHTMSFKDFFRDFWWISNILDFFQGFLMNGILSHHHSTNTRFPMISNDFQRSSWIFRDVRYTYIYKEWDTMHVRYMYETPTNTDQHKRFSGIFKDWMIHYNDPHCFFSRDFWW